VRLAQRVRDLNRLPFGLSTMSSIIEVKECYERSYKRIMSMSCPHTASDEERFRQLVTEIKKQDSHDQAMISQALQELMLTTRGLNSGGINSSMGRSMSMGQDWDFSKFLDNFYMSRISIRMLMGHYIAIKDKVPGRVGIINDNLKPIDVVKQAAHDAGGLCSYYYGNQPEVRIEGDQDFSLQYVQAHMYYIVFELLKNSMRATCEFNEQAESLPPIYVAIAKGDDDICIKISDRGGGIPRKGLDRLWTYSFTTARPAHTKSAMEASVDSEKAVMAGFGHGLPLSRLYARYWGGDVNMTSMENFGTYAFVHLHHLGKATEQLPE